MRTVIITGVSKGLGRSLANRFQDGRSRLVGFGRSRGDFAGEFHRCDLSKPEAAASVIDEALNNLELPPGEPIIFISNAGILGPLGSIQDLDANDIERAIAINLCGSAIAATCFLRRVSAIDAPKAFAQISSGAALPDRAKASWSLYCACKAGQEQLVRAVALEQARVRFPTKLVIVNPGVMETDMQAQIRAVSPESFPEVAEFIKMSEQGRIPSPDTIAEKIAVLLDDVPALESGRVYTFANYAKKN